MQSKVIYSCVVKSKKKVLCEYTEYTGKFTQMIKKILDIIQKEEIKEDLFKLSLKFSKYHFYVLFDSNIYFISMTNQSIFYELKDENYFYSFLFHLNSLLKSKYTQEQLNKAASYSLSGFLNDIKENMLSLNENQKLNMNLKEALNQLEKFNLIDSLNHKEFASDLNLEILDLVQVHENKANDWDPLEIRQSIYEKFKPKTVNAISGEEEDNKNISINDDPELLKEEGDNNTDTDLNSDTSYDLIQTMLRTSSSIEMPMLSGEPNAEIISQKKGKFKWILILILIIIIVIIVLILLKFAFKVF
ncbi:MAG: hypothetical protein MJ252_05175 [archaeon]|nr:hypothetical protein [archaeon]